MAKRAENTKAKKANTNGKKAEYKELNATEDIVVRVVRIYPGDEDRLSASLTIETTAGHIVIYGQAVNGKNGWFFSYPSYKGKDGEYHNVVYALEKEVNENISEALSEMLD